MLESKLHISNKSSIAIKLSLLVAILIASAVFIANVAPTFADGETKNINFIVLDSINNPVQNARIEIFISNDLNGEYTSESYAMTGSDGRALISTSSLGSYSYFVVSKLGYNSYWPDEILGQYSETADKYVIQISSIDSSVDINSILDVIPAIWTDKADYRPEEIVQIYGSAFDVPSIHLTISILDKIVNEQNVALTDGKFETSFQLDGITDVYTVTASYDSKILASTTFGDSPDQICVNLYPIDDASVRQNNQNHNYGLDTIIHTKYTHDGDIRRTYLKFDLSSIPAGSTINSATLNLFKQAGDNDRTVYFYLVTNDTWIEGTCTDSHNACGGGIKWNNAPVFSTSCGSISVLTANQYYSGGATSCVQGEFAGDKKISLLANVSESYSQNDRHEDFYSEEQTGTSQDPKLEVCYEVQCTSDSSCPQDYYSCSENSIVYHDSYCDQSDHTCKETTNTIKNCNDYNQNSCSDNYNWVHQTGTCVSGQSTCDQASSTGDCRDGQYCNGVETCSQGSCVSGTTVDCSQFNKPEISTCDNDPDNYYPTLDFRAAFTSTCDENTDSCTRVSETITHTCDKINCGAECDAQNPCTDKCVGNVRNYGGTCQGDCTCLYQTEDCDKLDNWYRTGKTQWLDETQCTEKEQAEEEYRDYSCDLAGCKHVVTNTRWVDTGNTKPKSDGTICDSSPFGMCDIQDTCQAGVCVNNVMLKGTECRPVFGDCDAAEVCDGVSQFCPQDSFLPDTVECRAQNGPCDVAEFCTGTNSVCPGDAIQQEGYICEYDKGQCEANDICDGKTKICNEKYAPLSTSCDNGIFCDGSDHCDGNGACTNLGPSIICDDQDQCTIDTCNEEIDQCSYTFTDKVGPTTSDLLVDPSNNNGTFDASATATDTCSNIKKSEYFVNRGLGSCGFVGTGTPMNPTDGSFDEKIEDIKKDNVQYLYDGLNYICIQSQDFADNWGNCECAYYDTDIIPPECPYNIYLDKMLYPDEYLVCGNNTWINATVCDEQSPIQGGEYFLDTKIPPIPAPWSGIWMNVLSSFARPSDNHNCAVIGALVDTSKLTDGTHYIKLRGKDSVENWGKIDSCMNVSFVRDTTSPETAKTLIPSEKQQHECSADEIIASNLPNGVSLTNGCQFVKGGTQVVLHATDPDPQGTDEHADKTKINWIVWYKVNPEDLWVIDQQGIGNENQDVTITLDKDSYHLIEYWSVDGCSWEETHHFELDIVDNKVPVTTKTIGEPKISNTAGEWFITQQTPIELSCVDQLPHPVDHVTLYARYNVDGGEWVDLLTKDGYVKFTFTEDSVHTLEWYCEDALGNKELTSTEIDRVDTTYPDTVKTYGTPLVEAVTGGYPKWITSQTPITLTATDGGAICAIGVDKTYWRNTLVDERYCENQDLCLSAQREQTVVLDFEDLQGTGQIPTDYKGLTWDSEWKYYSLLPIPPLYYAHSGVSGAYNYNMMSVISFPQPVTFNGAWFSGPSGYSTVQFYGYLGATLVGTSASLAVNPTPTFLAANFPDKVDRIEVHSTTVDYWVIDDFSYIESSWTEYTTPFYKPEQSCHLIEYYSVDSLGNTEPVKKQCVYVENTPPQIVKTVDAPKHECTLDEKTQYGNPDYGCWYITQNTKITLDCDDVMPHPVDNVVLYYRDYLLGQQAPSYTAVQGGYVDIYKTEDSEHVLEFYCADALGNSQGTAENPHKEIDIVDTQKPVSQKALGDPKHACTEAESMEYYKTGIPSDGCYFITQNTPIALTCTDGQPHPVDHVKIYYRDYLFGNTPPGFTEVADDHITITKTEDSAHILDWYCVDELGNTESTHVEYDIVDTQKPATTKELVGTTADGVQGQQVVLTFDDLHGQQPIPVGYGGVTWGPSWMYYDATGAQYYLPHSGLGRVYNNLEAVPFVSFPQPVLFEGAWFSGYSVPRTVQFYGYLGGELVGISSTLVISTTPPRTPQWLAANFPGPVDRVELHLDGLNNFVMDDLTYRTLGVHAWITQNTFITLTCSDNDPHPVNHVEIKYRYNVDNGAWTSWTTYTQPIKFSEDSVHTLEYYCVDALGNTETTHVEIDKVDSTPPITTKTYGTPLVEATPGGYPKWINSQTPVSLSATDGGAICAVGGMTTYWMNTLVDDAKCADQGLCTPVHTYDSQGWNTYINPFTKPEDSCHMIEYYSVDALGNKEPVKAQCVYVDNKSPITTKTLGDPKHECTLDEQTQYYGTTTPTDGCYFITQQTPITLSCTDQNPHPVDQVKIYYRNYLYGNTPPAFIEVNSNTITITNTVDSAHILEWYCKDSLGNQESTHTEYDIVDTLPPVSTKSFDGTNVPCNTLNCANSKDCDYYITQNTKIVLSCSDQEPHPVDHQKIYYRYFVDGQIHDDWTEYTVPIQYNENSKHTLDWYCVDALGNTEGTHTQIERVDSTPPLTTKTVGDPKHGNNDYWVTSQTPITLTTLDKDLPCASGPATLYYEVWWDSNCDGTIDTKVQSDSVTTDSNCKLETTIKLNEECLHEIKWHAVDALGNVETEHTQLHKVDNTPPHVLILKPVDGWYSDGEDIPVVTVAEDLSNTTGPCNNTLDKRCAVGIEDGRQCNAYLLDILPEFKTVALESHMTYNAEGKECQGYVTLNNTGSLIPDGITFLVVSTSDNLNNEGNSLLEIIQAIEAKCTDGSSYLECLGDVVQDIVTIWNLPKIGIDNHAPEVKITQPIEGILFGGQQVVFSADVTDANDGDVTSTITSGTPCYVTVGGISLGTVPYNNIQRKCSGTIMIPQDEDFPQGTRGLKVEIADNAGNIGSDTINVNVDTVLPLLAITMPSNNQFVSGTQLIKFSATDANLDLSLIKVSTDNGQTWKSVPNCGPNLYCYNWDTVLETDGMAYGIIAKATDQVGNTGYSEVVIVIVDNDAPEGVYVLNPIKNDIVQGTITLKALATDYVSGIKGVKIYVLSPVVWNCDAALIGGTWQCSFISTQLLDGAHEVYAAAKDNMDKETISAHVPFIIDNYAPTMPLGLIHIPSGNYVTQNTVTWKWQVSSDAGSGLDHYIIDIDGIDYTVSTSPESGFESYTINLLDGNHIARVKAVDKAGHATGWSNLDSLTIDTVSPSALTIYGTNIENPIYDTNGNYNINWNGGTDINFDRYELYEDSILIYTGGGISLSRNLMSEGNHEYQVKSYDRAGHVTVSSFFDVFVDKIIPAILTTSQSSWGPVGWWFGYSVNDGIKSSGLLTPTYSGGLNLCSFNPDTKTGSCLVFGNVANITVHVSDKAGHSTELTVKKGSEINTDFTPPELLSSGPSGVINYNAITLTATTDEPSACKYGTVDDYSTMTSMDGSGTTSHSVNLGTLTDGLKVYHVVCEDIAGNKMDSSKTIVFYIDTTGSYNLVIPDYGHYWSTGWNSFFLPEDMLEDICGDGKPYTVEKILSSLDGSDPSYDVLWYFDGTEWLFYYPHGNGYSSLTEFNDVNSLPYYIRLVREDRLEITQANCQLAL